MSYSITIRVYQKNTNAYFHVVEQTVWNFATGGTWSQTDEERTLTIGGTGTSGTMRFVSDTGESFIIAIGIHDYKRWCDIVTNLTGVQTGTVIHAEYYNRGPRAYQWEKQLPYYSVRNSGGRQFTVTFPVLEGEKLVANIIIS